MHARQLSDHSPVGTHASSRPQLPREQRPIPDWIPRTTIYKQQLKILEEKHNIDGITDRIERWELHKKLIRTASTIALREIMQKRNATPTQKLQTLASSARAVLYNNVDQVEKSIRALPDLQDVIEVNENATVCLKKPTIFRDLYRTIIMQVLETQSDEARAIARKKKGNNRPNMYERLKRLWVQFDSRLSLSGIILPDGQIVSDCSGKDKALADYWSVIFGQKRINRAVAEKFLRQYGSTIPSHDMPPPTSSDIKQFIIYAAPTATGPDGVPYSCWNATEKGPETLHGLSIELRKGRKPRKLNRCLGIFPPKGAEENDRTQPTRTPQNTRPLKLQNTDKKAIAGATNNRIAPNVSKWAHKSQKGFCRGRQGINNVIELDARGRILDMTARPGTFPLLSFWDFEAAFPSLSHEFLFLSLFFCGLPIGLLNLITGLYDDCEAYSTTTGTHVLLFKIRSGVLQGCPLSGTLFVIVINPLLRAMATILTGEHDALCAFADDLAAALHDHKQMAELYKIFQTWEEISAMKLKSKKGVIIMLGRPPGNPHPKLVLLDYLASSCPKWSQMAIAAAAKYLGFFLGPGAGPLMWKLAYRKYVYRTKKIASAKLPPAVSIDLYNTYAVPVLMYIAQVFPLDPHIIQQEFNLLHNLLHLVGRAMTRNMLQRLDAFAKAPSPLSLLASSYAARARTAKITATDWIYWRLQLQRIKLQQNDGMLANLTGSLQTRPWWTTDPIADIMAHAANGFPGDKNEITQMIAKEPIGKTNPEKKNNYQHRIYKTIVTQIYNIDPIAEMRRKLTLLCEQDWTDEENPTDTLREVLDELKKTTGHMKFIYIKTICNTWPTSRRARQDKEAKCPICGDGKDNLVFLQCFQPGP